MNGKITISRTSGGRHEHQPIIIQIEDETSGVRFCEVRMGLEDFANALTGRSYTDCVFDLRGVENVGKTRESKIERLPRPHYTASREELRALVAVHEVDGWKGSDNDAKNHHRWCGDNEVSVGYSRYVDTKPEPATP